jgi:hypothetical protein
MQHVKKAIEGGWIEAENWEFQYANAYWAIWKNGNGDLTNIDLKHYVLDPIFFQSLGKVCGWDKIEPPHYDIYYNREKHTCITWNAACFHEINLTEGWDAAVKWLNDLIK